MRTIELPSPETVRAAQVQPLLYTIEEAATVLNMSIKSVRRLVWLGRLTRLKGIRKVLIPRKQIEDYIKANVEAPKPAGVF